MSKKSLIAWGEPAPWFTAPTSRNPRFQFSSLGGRFILLAFIGESTIPATGQFLAFLEKNIHMPPVQQLVAFAVSRNKADAGSEGAGSFFPEGRVFHDPDFRIAKSFGTAEDAPENKTLFTGGWYILDPMLRVFKSGLLHEVETLVNTIKSLPRVEDHASPGVESWAPVLMVPRVLSPEFCRQLIDLYRNGSPRNSGFMREENGMTVAIRDPNFKRRHDIHIEDKATRDRLNKCLFYRLKPEIKKAFQFEATRIERYIIARYGEEDQGFFRPHRDNTTSGTAHRKFAITINLNAEDFDGGELRFPEFGMRSYKAPTGGAIVFSCSLLHEALPVIKGERFATLPFLYDSESAKIRAANKNKIVDYVDPPPPAEGTH